ncbi:MAG: asparaginase [Chloroflexi bacterium]|nr:MAG: asparaginase [Chloroflexota bacterium]
MKTTPYAPIFEISRGGITESIHYGSVAVVDSGGNLLAYYGDPYTVTYLRSSAKPFQAIPFLEHGGQQKYALTSKEIALICASHAGTDEHVATVCGIQAKTGVSEEHLMCGTHPISDPVTVRAMRERGEQPSPNRHNCSGKHTGMLAFTRLLNLPVDAEPGKQAYIDQEHPVQKEILDTFAEMCGLTREDVHVGIDGCSVPNFAVPLYNAAFGLARLCDPHNLPDLRKEVCRTITSSMSAYPFMVAGPNGFDTHLMEKTGGRIVSKGGAEGYQAIGLLPGALGKDSPGVGITIKISDGDIAGRSRPDGNPAVYTRAAVALEVLRQLGVLTGSELESLELFGPVYTIFNWRKLEVGQGKPCFQLQKS